MTIILLEEHIHNILGKDNQFKIAMKMKLAEIDYFQKMLNMQFMFTSEYQADLLATQVTLSGHHSGLADRRL